MITKSTCETITNVTRFGKTCIVHTSYFAHLEIHKNHREWYTALKLSMMIKGQQKLFIAGQSKLNPEDYSILCVGGR